MQTTNSVQSIRVVELIPYEKNSRVHSGQQIQQLANSIEQWGFTIPILVDENKMVLAGHGRLQAAKSLDIDEVPCIVAEGWTDAQKRAYIIADNKLAENSEWDMSTYYAELKALADTGFDLTFAGFDDDFKVDAFSPVLDPFFGVTTVGDVDVEKATAKMGQQIDGIKKDRSDSAMEVICPHCMETFNVSGY